MNLLRPLACIALACGSGAVGAHPLPEGGTCGFAAVMYYPFAYQYGQRAGPGWGVTVLGKIDWRKKTLAVNIVQIDPAGAASTEHQVQGSGSFVTAPGPIPDSARLTANLMVGGDTATVTLNALALDGEKVLLQSGPGPVGSADGGFVAECKR